MTPKEKALQLINRFTFADIYFTNRYTGAKINARQCAMIAVDEIIIAEKGRHSPLSKIVDYWEDVKTEINNL